MALPPLTEMHMPVSELAASETRKAITEATSSGSMSLPVGIILVISSNLSLVCLSSAAVLVKAGATELTVIPKVTTSLASALEKAIIPPLAAE